MRILKPNELIGDIFSVVGVDGADADTSCVMSPAEAEPELFRPAEHICYLQLTPRFCLVNILAAISVPLIFITWPVSSRMRGGRKKKRKKKSVDLTNVDRFSCSPINIGWQISLCQVELAELVEFGLEILGISGWNRDMTSHNLCPLPCWTYCTPFPAVLFACWWGELFYTAGKGACQSTLIFHTG